MELTARGFHTAVVIFTVAEVLLLPFFPEMAYEGERSRREHRVAASLGALIVTTILSDGLQIEGLTTWVVATLIVWGASLITTLLLPLLVFKSLARRRPPWALTTPRRRQTAEV